MSSYTVYKHTSPAGKVYIGITARPVSRRWHGGSAYRNNAHFYASIKRYGWEAFRHEILAEGLTHEAACEMEVRLIAEHRSTDPAHGYNISPGGDKTTLGYHYTPEARARISQALKGKRLGIRHTAEHAAHISQALMGHPCSEETRAKHRALMGDRFSTEEARAKQRANTPKGEKHHKATAVLCIDTGETYPTIGEAARAAGISRSNVSACCRGLQQKAGGLRWRYINRKGDTEG
jgi:group I intron endonuclease